VKFTCDTNVLVDVLRDPAAEDAFGVFLSRFSHVTYLSAIVMLELRAGARTAAQVRLLEKEIFQRFDRAKRVFTPSVGAFTTAGALLANLATREGWTAAAHPSLVHDALLAASCREAGVTLITRDGDFARLRTVLRGWRFVAPWPDVAR
jgi:predicted nucleic acid-binding protein